MIMIDGMMNKMNGQHWIQNKKDGRRSSLMDLILLELGMIKIKKLI